MDRSNLSVGPQYGLNAIQTVNHGKFCLLFKFLKERFMKIKNVDEMVHAYKTSPSLKQKIDSIMRDQSEEIILMGGSTQTVAGYLQFPGHPMEMHSFKGFEGAKLGKRG